MPTVIHLASPNALQQLSSLVQIIQTFIHFTVYQWNLSNFRLNEQLLSHLMLTPSIYLTITSTTITLTSSMDKKQHNHRCNPSPDSPPPTFQNVDTPMSIIQRWQCSRHIHILQGLVTSLFSMHHKCTPCMYVGHYILTTKIFNTINTVITFSIYPRMVPVPAVGKFKINYIINSFKNFNS